MHSSLNLDVLHRLATDRVSQLHAAAGIRRLRPRSLVLRSLGRQLMRLGTWLAADAPMRAAEAR